MTFLWPVFLWGLIAVPVCFAALVAALRRRRRPGVTFSRLDAVAEATRQTRGVRRYAATAVFLCALILVPVALARPVILLPVPSDQAAVMLAIDVSGSMMSQDVKPSRLRAAQEAAKSFVLGLPSHVRVGLVTFAGYATVLAPPTTEHAQVAHTIDGITVQHRTAIGDGLMEAVAALPGRVRPGPDGTLPPMPPGSRPPGFVVLLSDGQNNAGMDPMRAADLARRESVTVYTVGIGKDAVSDSGVFMIGGALDETTLRDIAHHTGGLYYHPQSGQELRDIYHRLAQAIGWQQRPTEITGAAAVVVAGLLVAALLVSVLTKPIIA
ncbi:MAG TPA: VWA domain-containing protein [bacterium]|nr:VWA domain-containing protein [bacterium]